MLARDLWRKYDWKQPNRLLVVQTSESVNQAQVFRAHAVLQGFRGHLIHALKLLANQQEDGDGFIQNIVTNFGERKQEWPHEGAPRICTSRQSSCPGSRTLERRFGNFGKPRPKGSEGEPEVTVRESPDELTLRAEEVGTWKSYINIDHVAKERWGLLR